jgi:hypothetical protein
MSTAISCRDGGNARPIIEKFAVCREFEAETSPYPTAPTTNQVVASGRLGLELVELRPRAGDHARQIRGQHHHVEAALHRP